MAYNPFTIDEYEVLACWMNTLAAEYHRTHDENIKAEIVAIASLNWPSCERPRILYTTTVRTPPTI